MVETEIHRTNQKAKTALSKVQIYMYIVQELFYNDSSALQMDAPGMMPGRISPLDIPGRLEQVRRRKVRDMNMF